MKRYIVFYEDGYYEQTTNWAIERDTIEEVIEFFKGQPDMSANICILVDIIEKQYYNLEFKYAWVKSTPISIIDYKLIKTEIS